MDGPDILVTNDDGVDATGLRVMDESLSAIGRTTVVAPQTEQSGTGRKRSYAFTVEEHELGYAVDGTPADCVNFGLRGLDHEFDIVVSGCNPGPNFGAHLIEHSGTVGAAKQSAFLGTPGVAVSLYCLPDGVRDWRPDDYTGTARFVTHLVSSVVDATEPGFDYVNVNSPDDIPATNPVRITELAYDCDLQIHPNEDGDGYALYDPFYDGLEPDIAAGITDPVGTDRRAIADGRISVTPLRLQNQPGDMDQVSAVIADYRR